MGFTRFLGILSGLNFLFIMRSGELSASNFVGRVPIIEVDRRYRPAAVIPPSTVRTAPVMNEACSDARKNTAFATSTGSPIRCGAQVCKSCASEV